MLTVEGQVYKSKAEYEDALYDKNIIDSVKARFNLSTKEGITAAYRELRTVHFKTSLGDSFDDEIFELYEGLKTGNDRAKSLAKTENVINIDNTKAIDKKIDLAARKAIKRQNFFRGSLITVLLLIGVGSIGYFIKYYDDARKVQAESQAFSELKDDKYADILKNVEQVIKKEYAPEVVIPPILDEYLALYNKNKSLIGWIKIADTIIDYPVMQTTDNDYYLKHNFNQEKDSNGCIFLDTNCDIVLKNDNYILYGHHMKNGKMFSSLLKYANKDFYEKHKTISFDTIYEKGTYEVMYAFRSRIYNSDEITFKYYQFIDANSKEEFDSYMDEMAKLSLIDTGVTASYGDRLLTLSTCDYQEDKNGRFVVVAKLVK